MEPASPVQWVRPPPGGSRPSGAWRSQIRPGARDCSQGTRGAGFAGPVGASPLRGEAAPAAQGGAKSASGARDCSQGTRGAGFAGPVGASPSGGKPRQRRRGEPNPPPGRPKADQPPWGAATRAAAERGGQTQYASRSGRISCRMVVAISSIDLVVVDSQRMPSRRIMASASDTSMRQFSKLA